MLTGFHTYAYKNEDNLKVVAIRFFCLSQWLYSSITDHECCNYSSREDSCCKHKKLVTGNEATVQFDQKRLQVCNVQAA